MISISKKDKAMLTISDKKKEGRAIARVKGGRYDKRYLILHENRNNDLSKEFYAKNPKMKKEDAEALREALRYRDRPSGGLAFIYDEALKDLDKHNKTEIRLLDGKLQPLPQKDIVERLYISGPSGAGKSTYASKWLTEYKKIYPDDPVFVFSAVKYDKVLDKHDIERIPLDESLFENPIDPHSDLAESISIFDDVDVITNSKIRTAVLSLRDMLLETGRHSEARLINTTHLLCNYGSTRRLLNEATSVTFFPRSGSVNQITRFLTTYMGLNKNQIEKVLNLPSRWVTCSKTFPQYFLHERGAFML
jgi:hypothetical protein